MKGRRIEFLVGLFIILGALGVVSLAVKVSGLNDFGVGPSYVVYADFANVGDLKPGAPVRIGGVKIGQVESINLDNSSFVAKVTMQLSSMYDRVPVDTAASIYTQGLLGSNYISLEPGFSENSLQNGSTLTTTHSAVILEQLIGKFLYNTEKGDKTSS